jgi:hypothetical protein
MVQLILNKIMYVLFFLSLINVIRHTLLFTLKLNDTKRYTLERTELFYLGLSISMLLTSIFSGIKIL